MGQLNVQHEQSGYFSSNLRKLAIGLAGLSIGLTGCNREDPAPTPVGHGNYLVTCHESDTARLFRGINDFYDEHPNLEVTDISPIGHGSHGRTSSLLVRTTVLPKEAQRHNVETGSDDRHGLFLVPCHESRTSDLTKQLDSFHSAHPEKVVIQVIPIGHGSYGRTSAVLLRTAAK